MMENNLLVCLLCEREVPELTEHHLIPRSRGGVETTPICRDCHRQIHALFSNKVLETEMNSYEAIIADERFAKYVKWVRKRPFGTVQKAKRAKENRSRGRLD